MGHTLHFPNSSLLVINIEREVNYDFPEDLATFSLVAVSLLVLPVNLIIVFWVKVIKDKTLIDAMILYDCVANIGLLSGFFFVYPKRVWDDDIYCGVQMVFRIFFTVLNRIIPVTIVSYRYILVCQVNTAERIGKTWLGRILNILTFLIPLLLSLASLNYPDDIGLFIQCRGRTESFYFDMEDFFVPVTGGPIDKLAIYHPYKLVTLIVSFFYTIVVPLGYYKIYIFIKKHNLQVQGITKMEHQCRRKKNLVTIGFKMVICVLEVVVGIILFIPISPIFLRAIICVSLSCGIAPILYIVGMSDVRESMERYKITIMRKMRSCCKRRNKVAAD